MNFGLANSFDAYTYEELSSSDIEMVSGGSGFGFNMFMGFTAGVSTALSGMGLAYAVSSGSVAAVAGATALATVGSGVIAGAAIVGGVALAGYAAYSYFG